MSERNINRLVAFGIFLFAFIIYFRTLSITVVFWDVGEFCAASWLLQVPHPPGSPLFILIARIVSMVPFVADVARRMHAISAFAGGLGASFIYLNIVRLINRFRGVPATAADRFTTYGSAVIGALAMAFSATFWDNSIEAEVYGLSMLFVSMILWISLLWWDHADEPHNEKYILMVAYMVGLSIGVHLLSLLVLFTIMMVFFFRKNEFNRKNLMRLLIIGVPAFFVIYPGIVQLMPSMLDGNFIGIDSDLWPFVPLIIIIAVAYYAWKSAKTKQKWLNIAALSFLMIVLGYTTYFEVLIRANVHAPMNENNPNNLVRFVSYINREQYGNTPIFKGQTWDNDLQGYRETLFPRRWSQESMHEPTRTNYTSDADFFWRWQVNHMFLRYLFQNYIGAEGDWQDAGVSWKETWGIPFLIGLFGFYWHFKRDWKNFLPIFVMFLVMGLVFVIYANMQEPQPRERDYFYVGAFYAFCIWIAFGVVGIIELIRNALKNPQAHQYAAAGIVLVGFVTVPISMLRMNYHENDRSGNYVAWDYSYNLLQSCDPNAILFTNGDNDTFPLWYLQDVEGIRTDVRIANLSLINTSWYIAQLKNERPHGTEQVPISLSDQQIERIEPRIWQERKVDLPVPDSVIREYGVTDTSILKTHKITFTMSGTQMNADTRIIRVQDMMVQNIIMTNNWKRPIDFAITCSPDSKIGLDHYLWMQGMVWRLKPNYSPNPDGGIDPKLLAANFLAENVTPSKTWQPGFRYRNLNNPNQYYDENVTRMILNYRAGFCSLAEEAAEEEHNQARGRQIIDQMERVMPITVVSNEQWTYTYKMMTVAQACADSAHFNQYSKILEDRCRTELASPAIDDQNKMMMYRILLDIYEARKDYANAIDMLNRMQEKYPDDPSIKGRIDMDTKLLAATRQGIKDTVKK